MDGQLSDSPGRRAAWYWFTDGIPDLAVGCSLLAAGAVEVWWRTYLPHPLLGHNLIVLAGFMLYLSAGKRAIGFLKSRITWQRTGYAQPPECHYPQPASQAISLLNPPDHDQNVTKFDDRTVWFTCLALMQYSQVGQVPLGGALLEFGVLAFVLWFFTKGSEHPYRIPAMITLTLTGLLYHRFAILPLFLVGGWFLIYGLAGLGRYLYANPRVPA